jgi:GntR family histidine utilization transcriptional repressor
MRRDQLVTILTHLITSGHYLPGELLPGQRELAVQYGCSRMTVMRAMGDLQKAGLITLGRRGSVVAKR